MENADEYDEYDETPITPRCGYCGTPMFGQRRGAVYCGRRCKELDREKRRRDRARVETLRQKHPSVDLSLAEAYARSTPPRRAVPQADDEAGHLGDEDDRYRDEADAGPGAWSDIWRLHKATEAIRARYQRLAQPYETQLRRNPGVRPVGLVALERQRDAEIKTLIRAHEHAAELDRAQRNAPKRINEAHTRQMERAALQALGNDLPGGSRRYQPPEYTGRATSDIWRW